MKIFKSEFISSSEVARQIYIDELKALSTLHHPNIVKMYDYGITGRIESDAGLIDNIWYLIMEYVSERTLVDLIVTYGGVQEEYVRYFFRQIVDTLLYIKSKGIAHRDIKLENLLLDTDYNVKFSDFGFASCSTE